MNNNTHIHNASRQHIGLHSTPARCTLQFVRRCYGLRGIYGRFNSKIWFQIESDGRFDSRFDSNAKKTIRRSLLSHLNQQLISCLLPNEHSQLHHTQICQSRATEIHYCHTFSAADLHDWESSTLSHGASCMAWNKTTSDRGNARRLTTSSDSTLWIQSINRSLPSVSVYHNKIQSTDIHTDTHVLGFR